MDEVTFLFTDIEGSTRLWEQHPERMRPALAFHDAAAREAVASHGGSIVKSTGDGIHAAFHDPADALKAAARLQAALADPAATQGLQLLVRCGLHCGRDERRDGDFFGTAVNRAARIMAAAHGGQVLLSEAVAMQVRDALPEDMALRDLGSARLRDLSRPERIFQLTHPALRADFPPLRSLERTPNNLPVALTSFVGRERELKALGELMGRSRLVTVLGMGGLGKSRLALEAAANAIEDFPDGVWLVELAQVQDARWVPQAIAWALHVKAEAGRPLADALSWHARTRTMLILLDNCEHVIEGAAAITREILSAGPAVRILATSREPLRIPGESIFPLGGLPVPGPREALSIEAVSRSESVRLFIDRAASVMPGFALDATNGAALAAICHRLDGIPLAIELAAARARSISLAQIAARLKDRFTLLTSGDPTASPRQRTLRATIDWSHELLPDEERALFRRLAVFPGGWTLETAERVCAGDGVEAGDVLDLLSRLVEKSLVAPDREAERYRMLETVREYALQRLAGSGEQESVGQRHLGHFLALALAARPELAGPRQAEWLARLDAEHENILLAHAWAGRSPRHAADGLALVEAMKHYWAHRGLLELGHRVTEEALARQGGEGLSALRALALFNLGQFRYFMGRPDALATLEECLCLARQLGDVQLLGRVLPTLGMAAIGQGRFDAARGWLQEAVERAEASGDKRGLAASVNALAMLLRVEQEHAPAMPLYRQVVALAREAGDREAESVGLLNLSMLYVESGDLPAASQAVAAALAIASEIGSTFAVQSGLEVCAGIAAARGEAQRAARLFGAAEASAARTGVRRDAADERYLAPRISAARAALGEAAFEAAAAAGAAIGAEAAVAEVREWLPAAADAQTA